MLRNSREVLTPAVSEPLMLMPAPEKELQAVQQKSRTRKFTTLQNASPEEKLPRLKSRSLIKSFEMPVREFVRANSKLDRLEQAPNYALPVNYPDSLQQSIRYTHPKDSKTGARTSYLGLVITKAKQTVRPGHYSPLDKASFAKSPKETPFAFSKQPKKTFIDEIRASQRKSPSPNTYKPKLTHKVSSPIKS